MELVTRSSWRARSPKQALASLSSTKGVKVHYTGDYMNPVFAQDHKRCPERVRQIQSSHMDGNGWSDIGYSAVVCYHGVVYVGRGPHKLPAANGEGLNSGHYAVCGLVGDTGTTQPSPAMLIGIRDAIEWLRREGNAGNEIKGHRDGYSTSCPGTYLYSWVKAGAPRPSGQVGEDDMDPKTDVVISPYWKEPGRNQFSHDVYDAGFLWTGAVAETRIYGKKTLAELAALREMLAVQNATITKLAQALVGGQIMTPEQSQELQETVREAFTNAVESVERLTVSLEVREDRE